MQSGFLNKTARLPLPSRELPNASDVVAKVEKESDDDTERRHQSMTVTPTFQRSSTTAVSKNMASQLTTSDKIDRVVTNRILALPIFVVVMFLVYYISVSTVGTIATDWANDGVFGDGWYLGSGQEQFDEVSEEFESAQESVDAFEAAAEEEDLDPASETFIEDAEAAGLTATYESYDDETGENETVEVDVDAYQEALDVLAPYQGDQNAIAAFEAAAIEEGLDA